jgi:F-type H+-transporting ATPase subunit delta
MRDRKLAVRYARALLSALPDPQQAEAADRFLGQLGSVMEESPKFRDMMLDPAFSNAERKTMLRRMVADSGLPRQMGNFLDALVDHRRASVLPSIALLFRELRQESLGIVPAEIATATPLSDELQERASAAVERLTGRRVRLACRVEPTLIGGAVTTIGSVVYDGSLRTQLTRLRRRMAEE